MAAPHLVITSADPAERDALAARTGHARGRARRRVDAVRSALVADLVGQICPRVVVTARFQEGATPDVVVGAASAVLVSAREAEVAVWVAGEWRRQGIGTVLLCELLDRLSARGVRRAEALVEHEDLAARRLFGGVEALVTGRRADGLVELTVALPDRVTGPGTQRRGRRPSPPRPAGARIPTALSA